MGGRAVWDDISFIDVNRTLYNSKRLWNGLGLHLSLLQVRMGYAVGL